MSEVDSLYFVEIIRGVEEMFERAGLSMVLTTTSEEERRHRGWIARVIEDGTDGVILVLPDEHASYVEELRSHGIPFAVVDDRGENLPDVPSAGATNFANGFADGFAATEYLLWLGHRRIAVIGGQPYKCTTARLAGYRAACQEAGVPIDPL